MDRDIQTDGSGFQWRVLALAAVAGLVTGCHIDGPEIPKGWVAAPAKRLLMDSRRDQDPRLQVIICYGWMMSHHSDLRLTCPQRAPLFWDPGGDFKENDPQYKRMNDLMHVHSPDVLEWWEYRSGQWREPFMKVFEWDLTRREAEQMHTILLQGCVEPGEFRTETHGGFCNIAVSGYLQRFAGPRVDVPDAMIWPDSLARHLWTQQPDRVLVFEGKKKALAYERPRAARGPR